MHPFYHVTDTVITKTVKRTILGYGFVYIKQAQEFADDLFKPYVNCDVYTDNESKERAYIIKNDKNSKVCVIFCNKLIDGKYKHEKKIHIIKVEKVFL